MKRNLLFAWVMLLSIFSLTAQTSIAPPKAGEYNVKQSQLPAEKGGLPAPTNVMADPATIVVGETSNLSAESVGNTILWYDVETDGVALGSSASGANFPVSPESTTTYFAEAFAAPLTEELFIANSSRYGGSGVYFTVTAPDDSDLIIDGFPFRRNSGNAGTNQIYYKTGGYSGFEANQEAWTLYEQVTLTQTAENFDYMDITNFTIPAGSTYSFMLYSSQGMFIVLDQNITVSNDFLTLSGGSVSNGLFSSVFSGNSFWGGIRYVTADGETSITRTPVTVTVEEPFVPIATEPSAGDGTAGDPFQIGTLENLYWVASNHIHWDKHFILTSNIDATETQLWNAGQGWDPIGDWFGISDGVNPFTGVFDGNGFMVSNIYINRPDKFIMGFFGYTTNGAVIKNLTIDEINITGNYEIGGLIGAARNTTIENCGVRGNITGTSSVGGLVGDIGENSTISKSWSGGSVTGEDAVGGLAGKTGSWGSSIIEESFSIAMVFGSAYDVGGFAGMNGSDGIIRNCFSLGDVSRTGGTHDGYGAFAGFVNPGGIIEKSYSTGSVFFENADDPVDNGFVAYGNGVWSGNFFDSENSNQTLSHDYYEAATGLSEAEMQNTCNFIAAGWDFVGEDINGTDDIWAVKTEPVFKGYPVLNWMSAGDLVDLGQCPQAPLAGDGSAPDPYQLESLEMLLWLSQNPDEWDKHYVLTSDIDATETQNWNDGEGWQPVGNSTTSFTGFFDGAGFEIQNLFINRTGWSYLGFFGKLENATVQNLNFSGADITGHNNIATLAGNAINSNIINCHVVDNSISSNSNSGGLVAQVEDGCLILGCSAVGTVVGESATGGLIGYSELSIINKCYAGGTVTGENWEHGGLIGSDSGSTISESWSDADVSSRWYTGGFIGFSYGSNIMNCYATGSATATDGEGVGGFIGEEDADATITNCYSTALVNGSDDDNTGGFNGDGYDDTDGTITQSFWDIEVSGQSESKLGFGLITMMMKKFKTFYEAGWDFKGESMNGTDFIWNIGNDRNNGYPYFSWQYPDDKAPQLILADEPAGKTYGDAAFDIASTVTSGLDVDIQSSNTDVATISGNTLTIVGAGETMLSISQSGNEAFQAAETVEINVTVLKASLSLTVNNDTKVYGVNDPLYSVTPDGLVYEEDLSVLDGTLAFDRTIGEDVGLYVVTASGLTSGNYILDFIAGELEITPAALSITANSSSKTYGVGITFTGNEFLASGLVAGDEIVSASFVSDGAAANASVGEYPVLVSDATGSGLTNYNITYAEGLLSVGKRTLAIAGSFTVADKEYDGTTDAVFESNNLILESVLFDV